MEKTWVQDVKKSKASQFISKTMKRNIGKMPHGSQYVTGPNRSGNSDEVGIYFKDPTTSKDKPEDMYYVFKSLPRGRFVRCEKRIQDGLQHGFSKDEAESFISEEVIKDREVISPNSIEVVKVVKVIWKTEQKPQIVD